jgi:hypothetical protein
MLRGALGHALAALDPAVAGEGKGAPYDELYAGGRVRTRGEAVVRDDVPRPYTLEWAADAPGRRGAGEAFDVDVVLFGRAAGHVPAVAESAATALDAGLGERRVPCVLERARVIQDAGCIDDLAPRLDGTAASRLDLTALTPLLLDKDPKQARRPTFEAFLRAARRRARMMAHFHGRGQVPAAEPGERLDGCDLDAGALRWVTPARRSARQRRTFKVGGLVGPLAIVGPWGRFAPILRAALVLHVGRHATLGHGRVVVGSSAAVPRGAARDGRTGGLSSRGEAWTRWEAT